MHFANRFLASLALTTTLTSFRSTLPSPTTFTTTIHVNVTIVDDHASGPFESSSDRQKYQLATVR